MILDCEHVRIVQTVQSIDQSLFETHESIKVQRKFLSFIRM